MISLVTIGHTNPKTQRRRTSHFCAVEFRSYFHLQIRYVLSFAKNESSFLIVKKNSKDYLLEFYSYGPTNSPLVSILLKKKRKEKKKEKRKKERKKKKNAL